MRAGSWSQVCHRATRDLVLQNKAHAKALGVLVSHAEFFGSPLVSISVQAQGLPSDKQPLLMGETEGTLVNGSFIFSSLGLRARPGRVIVRVLSYLSEVKQPLNITMTAMPCPTGTVPSLDGLQCDGCRSQTFSIWRAVEQVSPHIS